jgi:chromosome segregation ATPase
MATESADESGLSVTLPPPLEEWLEERADSLDIDREELVVQLLSAYRTTADLDEPLHTGAPELDEEFLTDVERRIETVDEESIERLDRRVASIESELDEHIEDIRSRVLQLRDRLQDRAETDHDHPEIERLRGQVDRLSEDLESVGSELADLSDTVETVDGHLEDMTTKLNRLARIVVAMRDRSDDVTTERQRHLDELKHRAGSEGITAAKCAGCANTVNIGLLTDPSCPNCGVEFGNLEPSKGFFGSPKLTIEDPPAIEGGGATDE